MARSLVYIEVLIELLSRSLPRLISTVAAEVSRSMLHNTPIRLCATAHNSCPQKEKKTTPSLLIAHNSCSVSLQQSPSSGVHVLLSL